MAGKITEEELRQLDLKTILDAVRKGEPWIMPIYEEVVDYLAMMVSSISAILDPEVIIFSGGLSAIADLFIPEIMHRLEGRQPAGVHLNLKQSTPWIARMRTGGHYHRAQPYDRAICGPADRLKRSVKMLEKRV